MGLGDITVTQQRKKPGNVAAGFGQVGPDQVEALGSVLDPDDVAGHDQVTGDVDPAAVDRDVPVRNELPGLTAAATSPPMPPSAQTAN